MEAPGQLPSLSLILNPVLNPALRIDRRPIALSVDDITVHSVCSLRIKDIFGLVYFCEIRL